MTERLGEEVDGEGHLSVRIFGRVQGVGFRRWTQKQALRLQLRGTVENLPDGSVEVQAAGAVDRLADLEQRLEAGPWLARVDRIEEVEEKLPDDCGEFRIAY